MGLSSRGWMALLKLSVQTCWMCHCIGVFGEAVLVEGRPREEHCFSEDSDAVAHSLLHLLAQFLRRFVIGLLIENLIDEFFGVILAVG